MRFLLSFLVLILGLGGWFSVIGMRRVEPGHVAWREDSDLAYGAGIYPTIPLYVKWSETALSGFWLLDPFQVESTEGLSVQWHLALRFHRVPCSTDAAVAKNDGLPPPELREQILSRLQGRPLSELSHPSRNLLDSLLISEDRGLVLDEILLVDVRPLESKEASWAQKAAKQIEAAELEVQQKKQALELSGNEEKLRFEKEKTFNSAELTKTLAAQKRAFEEEAGALKAEAEKERLAMQADLEARLLALSGQVIEAEAERKSAKTKAELEVFAGEQGRYLQAILAAEQFKLGPIHLATDQPQALREFGSVEAWRKFFLGPQ